MKRDVQIITALEDEGMFLKEHIYILCHDGLEVAKGYVYPYTNASLNPAHPFNVYLDIKCDAGYDEQLVPLLEKLIQTAKSLIESNNEFPARLYFSASKSEFEKKQWLASQNMNTEVGLYTLSKRLEGQDDGEPVDFIDPSNEDDLELFLDGYFMTFSEQKTKDWLKTILRDQLQLYMIKDQGCLIGAGLIKVDGEIGFIDTIFVLECYKRKGYGLKLLKMAHNHFIRKKIKEVVLEVWAPNQTAIGFYKSLGYEIKDISSFTIGKTLKKDLKE